MSLSSFIQNIRATRLYKTNPAARAELDALGDAADVVETMTEAQYLDAERQIIAKYRGQ